MSRYTPDHMELLELSWLAKQQIPVWGGHLQRGEPVEDTALYHYVERGLIEEFGGGYRITTKGLAFVLDRKCAA